MLIYDLFEKWLKMHTLNIRPKTYTSYQTAIRQVTTVLPNKDIKSITEEDCQNAINELFLTYRYSKSTLKSIRVVLHQSLKYAKKQLHCISYNPAADLDIPHNAPEKFVDALSVQEQNKVEEFCKTDPYGLIIVFFLYTGLRRGELINLKWIDYNQVDQTIQIQQSKTKNGVRKIPLVAIAQQIISRQPKRSAYIFTQSNGHQITDTVLKKTYLRIRKNTGVDSLTIHVCRHTFATRLVESGADMKAISMLLGHSNEQFTASRYTHPNLSYLQKQIKLLNVSFDMTQ